MVKPAASIVYVKKSGSRCILNTSQYLRTPWTYSSLLASSPIHSRAWTARILLQIRPPTKVAEDMAYSLCRCSCLRQCQIQITLNLKSIQRAAGAAMLKPMLPWIRKNRRICQPECIIQAFSSCLHARFEPSVNHKKRTLGDIHSLCHRTQSYCNRKTPLFQSKLTPQKWGCCAFWGCDTHLSAQSRNDVSGPKQQEP